eukprot:CAMPEP_0196778636 /NCGR_PEP_ID=MMETSP1104-20130614/5919_1 /TAXON_ID=33652 /ORGANISM="Cafeteria sp., Strain Caron Lab Isolate" /LENGTH=457 /DNA_ID=CAMNT_0042148809 /DNA_START=11 /DNA_END=1384 /DNA_ORIENTATION=+
MVLGGLYAVVSLVIGIMGGFVFASVEVEDAFGAPVNNCALTIVITAGGTLVLACWGLYGAKRHNKCCLMVFWMATIVCLTMQVLCSLTIVGIISPRYSDSLQSECTRHDLGGRDASECQSYLGADHTQRIYAMWTNMVLKSETDEQYKQTVTQIEDGSGCCGFSAPLQCVASRDVPEGQSSGCGLQDGWYPVSIWCSQTVGGAVQGCRYDDPVSDCFESDVTDGSQGCALAAEEWVYLKVAPFTFLTMSFWLVEFLAICGACCLCLKRKESDVLPRLELTPAKREQMYYAIRAHLVPPTDRAMVGAEPELRPARVRRRWWPWGRRRPTAEEEVYARVLERRRQQRLEEGLQMQSELGAPGSDAGDGRVAGGEQAGAAQGDGASEGADRTRGARVAGGEGGDAGQEGGVEGTEPVSGDDGLGQGPNADTAGTGRVLDQGTRASVEAAARIDGGDEEKG